MSKISLFVRFALLMGFVPGLLSATPSAAFMLSAPVGENQIGSAAVLPLGLYDTGNPSLRDLWVDPVNGSDANDGATPATALRTLAAAWTRVPMNVTLTQGVRINLQPGTYAENTIPIYWESRHGTFAAPIWIRGNGASRGQVVLQGGMNIYDTDYIYFENLSASVSGDVFHCEACDHVLLRNVAFNGGGAAQETVKVNQSQYLYIENSDISGAWDNAIDFVAVQYGHILGNQIHNAGDWCAYAKGGSAYLRVEANVIYNCGTGGFTAGQGTGFQFMVPPWIQYEAYDIKVVNNVIHDTEGAGLGVNGGYNILLAYNTLYRVGSRSHVIEVVFGGRSCDGQSGDPGRERCQQYLNQGGWGTTVVDDGTNAINIPNKNVFIYNNIVYNPPGFQSAWQHFAIYDARTNPPSSNIPYATTDANLQIRGNVIWNGSASMPLGIEGHNDACIASDPTCNETQLRADNAINTVQPSFVNAAGGDFHPSGVWLASVTWYNIPDYVWDISVPPGTNSNAVPTDIEGANRAGQNAPGAYVGSSGGGGGDTQTSTFTSNGAQDGWILESRETSGTGGSMNTTLSTLRVGDDARNRQYRSILSFDTSSLRDNAVILSIELRVRYASRTGGLPFTSHQGLFADITQPYFGTSASLAVADFQFAPGLMSAGRFGETATNGWYSLVLDPGAESYVNLSGLTQFRLRFALDDDNDLRADFVSFFSGNAGAANRPVLVIEYQTP